eukprot:scaffold24708_cov101-Isochrysis_galbana.AAC.3
MPGRSHPAVALAVLRGARACNVHVLNVLPSERELLLFCPGLLVAPSALSHSRDVTTALHARACLCVVGTCPLRFPPRVAVQ